MPVNGTRGRQIDRECAVCGSAFKAWASEVNRGRGKCCSRKCAAVIANNAPRLLPPKRGKRKSPASVADRLLDNVVRDPVRGCWLWKRCRVPCGYGLIAVDRRLRQTHRVSYELFCGPLGEGLEVMHVCDVPPCINPVHLKLGTHTDNMRDASRKGRMRNGKLKQLKLRKRKRCQWVRPAASDCNKKARPGSA